MKKRFFFAKISKIKSWFVLFVFFPFLLCHIQFKIDQGAKGPRAASFVEFRREKRKANGRCGWVGEEIAV